VNSAKLNLIISPRASKSFFFGPCLLDLAVIKLCLNSADLGVPQLLAADRTEPLVFFYYFLQIFFIPHSSGLS
jgi:hypothetical protein